ncbi:hypothetical protein C3B44_06980 [Corynebacterium yudongzhengii]|uniref:PspC domain-containing protein n=1 Tax=Corynebacterium yudongzhengii TaxID=2080740 RepID=A0A2U1T9E8_9CORY|nr:PspC domain-containing protein [Corynebacterium yudongzhengii]AWB82133.1 hypothetical protein C3B44_06980 [Corynebacterium yudongzhengii]PWC02637.1 PspC domain-containing protein [Corynebacterium yudongzhengii]
MSHPHSLPYSERRLMRSHTDYYIAGVLGGFAETYGVDPTLVRILFAVGTLMSFGVMVPLYLVAWVVMP